MGLEPIKKEQQSNEDLPPFFELLERDAAYRRASQLHVSQHKME